MLAWLTATPARLVRTCGFRSARHLSVLPYVCKFPNRTQEIIAFGYKGSIKFRYDTCSHITVSTPFDLLLEKLLFHITSKEHTIAKFTQPTKSHTEIEIISDTISEIFCVWTLASQSVQPVCRA